jgi:hypothetical protein
VINRAPLCHFWCNLWLFLDELLNENSLKIRIRESGRVWKTSREKVEIHPKTRHRETETWNRDGDAIQDGLWEGKGGAEKKMFE